MGLPGQTRELLPNPPAPTSLSSPSKINGQRNRELIKILVYVFEKYVCLGKTVELLVMKVDCLMVILGTLNS